LSSGVGQPCKKLSHAALDRQRWAAIVPMTPTGIEPTVVDDDDEQTNRQAQNIKWVKWILLLNLIHFKTTSRY